VNISDPLKNVPGHVHDVFVDLAYGLDAEVLDGAKVLV
jgi:hypothetical protein